MSRGEFPTDFPDPADVLSRGVDGGTQLQHQLPQQAFLALLEDPDLHHKHRHTLSDEGFGVSVKRFRIRYSVRIVDIPHPATTPDLLLPTLRARDSVSCPLGVLTFKKA